MVRAAFAETDPARLLAALHAFELTFADNMEWPWMRWRYLSIEDPAYLNGFPEAAPNLSDNPFVQTILDAAHVARRGAKAEADLAPLKAIFLPDSGWFAKSEPLAPSLQLELMMLAFHERLWNPVHKLARRLISMDIITGDPDLNTRVQALLLETLFFCIYRPFMPYYVANPGKLIKRLKALQKAPAVAPIMRTGGMAAKTIKANMLAMQGQFDEALVLYGDVAAATGFRTPVFQQTQILMPLTELTNEARETDMSWYKERSQTSFHYPHATEAEHALLVAVEPGYFKQYGDLYARIVGTTNPGALIHFHMINFDDKPAAEAALNVLAADANVRINHTFEDNQMMIDRPQLKGGVCVNTRYIYLPEYLAAYRGVTITDIDGWLLKSMDDLTDFGDRDSLVSSWIWNKNTGYWRLPWGNLSGGYCSIKSTDSSKRFAGLVAHYLTRLFARNAYTGKPMFYADQAAHFLCLKKAEADYGMKVGFVGGGFAQSEELPFHDRHAGKRQAMQDKLDELTGAAAGA